MAEPSNAHIAEGENPYLSSPAAVEEEEEGSVAPGGGLPVLRWSERQFDTLMASIRMPQ
ncbi:hypothetical protein Hanom_Chr07g00629341 [Helianthus anomalus]